MNFDHAVASVGAGSENLSHIERPINLRIFYAVTGAVVLFALIGCGRLLQLGIVQNNFYTARAELNTNKEIPIVAPRGIITDRYGKPLVENKLIFSLFLRVSDMVKNNEKDQALLALESILNIPQSEIIDKLSKADLEKVNDVIISQDITREQTIKINSLNLASLYVQNDYKRDYLDPAFSHVVGYVGLPTREDLAADGSLSLIDVVGRSGLEGYYNDYLKGANGLQIVYRNPKVNPGNSSAGELVRDEKIGNTLKTTIDADLQKYFYQSLTKNTQLRGQNAAVGIALNPKTGEILSLISLPSFDANNIGKYLNVSTHPLFDRAISGVYNPGSTIKPLDGVAGLSEGVITPALQIYNRGYIEVPNQYDPAHPSRYIDHYCCGWNDLNGAIARSSDVYFYAVGGGLAPSESAQILKGASSISGIGIDRLNKYWDLFGLSAKSGIDLPGEANSFLPNPDEKQKRTGSPWRVGDTYNISIGQGDIAVNMIQLADYMAAVANKGIAYKPHIKETDSPEVLLDLSQLKPELKKVEIGMADSVYKPYGTSYSMASLVPFKIAAKTGTAQTNLNTRINALFVGYGPTDAPDGPSIEVLVLIENAKDGSLNAIPVAEDVFNWYYENRMSVKPVSATAPATVPAK